MKNAAYRKLNEYPLDEVERKNLILSDMNTRRAKCICGHIMVFRGDKVDCTKCGASCGGVE